MIVIRLIAGMDHAASEIVRRTRLLDCHQLQAVASIMRVLWRAGLFGNKAINEIEVQSWFCYE
jgi:hypothetical protein